MGPLDSNAGRGDFGALLKKSGLTTAQTATLCDVDPRTVRRWRSSGHSPTSARLLLSLIISHGLQIITTDPHGLRLLAVMVAAMADQGKGLAAIQRRLHVGYGVINRLLIEHQSKKAGG